MPVLPESTTLGHDSEVPSAKVEIEPGVSRIQVVAMVAVFLIILAITVGTVMLCPGPLPEGR